MSSLLSAALGLATVRLSDGDVVNHREVVRQADAEIERAERMLKIAQVARMANVSERTVWRDIRRGTLEVRYPVPGRPRVPVEIARVYAGIATPSDISRRA